MIKKTTTLLLLIGLFCLTSQAQFFIEPCKFGQPLINALQMQYTPTNYAGYGPARDLLYSRVDNVGNDLSCVYTTYTVTLDPNLDPSQSAYQNGAGLNAEHIYPQAKGAGSEPERGDMHNIRPCRVNVNSDRGNCPYNEIADSDTETWYFDDQAISSIPSSNIDAYSERDTEDCQWEPREEMKGDLARTIFYFYGIYQSTADAEDPNFFPLQKNILLQWHYQDLPDASERRRDSLISLIQGNRNPFVLDSSLARRAFFMADASYASGDTNCMNVNTAIDFLAEQNWIQLKNQVAKEAWYLTANQSIGKVSLYDFQGRVLREMPLEYQTTFLADGLPAGYYILKISSFDKEKWIKVVKE